VTNDKLAQLLGDLDRRLAAIAAQAEKAAEQVQKALVQVNGLREDVDRIRKAVISNTETAEYSPAKVVKKPGRK
jgi:hypothetical protein